MVLIAHYLPTSIAKLINSAHAQKIIFIYMLSALTLCSLEIASLQTNDHLVKHYSSWDYGNAAVINRTDHCK
jgi:hypothetical protein